MGKPEKKLAHVITEGVVEEISNYFKWDSMSGEFQKVFRKDCRTTIRKILEANDADGEQSP